MKIFQKEKKEVSQDINLQTAVAEQEKPIQDLSLHDFDFAPLWQDQEESTFPLLQIVIIILQVVFFVLLFFV